jgi:phosphatidylinositol alpha-mannosyltransferase
VTLDVVGKGEPPADAPGVTFHGPVADEAVLAEHYRACDVFVAPATGQESFGIVLLEAMASGKPIVCSDIAGYRQVVSADGARLVPPMDVAGLAQAIGALAGDADLRRRMGEVNLERAAQFDWEQLSSRVLDEYQLAVDERQHAERHRVAA